MKINLFAFIAFICFQGITCDLLAQPQIFLQYELSSIYQPVTVNKIIQDPFGKMWLGTSKGLFSFDGTDFTNQSSRENSSANITALFCDSNFIWIGFEDGRVAHRSLKVWIKDFIPDTNYHAPISRIIKEPSGKMWIATYGNGLFIQDKKSLLHITTKDGLPDNGIYSMALGKDGTIWMGTDGGLTACSAINKQPALKTYTPRDGLPDEIVRCLEVSSDGTIWIGTQDKGVCYFKPETKTFAVLPFSYQWDRGAVSALSIQQNNRLMIGTFGKGLISISIHDNYHPIIYDQSTGYDNAKVNDIEQDNEGNFWVASLNRGLDLFPALFEWMQLKDPFSKEAIEVVMHDDQAHIWFATLNSLYKMRCDSSGNNSVEAVKLTSSAKQPVITSMYEDHFGNIWIGTFDEGIFLNPFRSNSFIQILQKDGLANDNVLSITGDEMSVWISTLGGVTRCDIKDKIRSKSDFSFRNFTQESGLNSNYIYQTFIDSKKRIWFATDGNGLKMLENGKYTTYENFDTFKIKTIYSITEDKNGNIWFSTPSNGLFKFDGKTFTNYGLEQGISDLAISGILADENGDIVILENDAIDILETKTNQVRRYRGKPPFEDISPNLNCYDRDQHGNIWIATKKGILKYYTPSPDYSHEAQVEIQQVLADFTPVNYEQVNRMKFDNNHITFDFLAYWYSNPSQISYRYMLEGHDLDWVKTKDQRAIYPELSPGTYVFKVQSTIHRDFTDAPTQFYTFTILPPFWKTWWFITSCAIVGSTLIYFWLKARDKRREREEKLKREQIEFQLENLKTQINPHFLFNSFNTLASLVEENQKTALVYIDHLSDFFRSLLAFKDVDLVTLKEELEVTNDYIFLLRQRHGDRLQVNISVSKDEYNLKIPPLTLQMLIENAVKHNVVSKDQPLAVEIFTTRGSGICVQNNLQKKRDVDSTRFGLQNIRARCELLGSKDFTVIETLEYFRVCVPLFRN